ncbi:MAG TPA: dUTP diphosphatase [Candidatus Vogelbacteria bacterium]|nr:dUTP diphosphatase [Candidatus Vogelbacteria bacterium]
MSQKIRIKVKKLVPEAILPVYALPGDAGFDVFSIEEIKIPAKKWAPIRTGLAIEIPDGFVSLVWDKSGLALKNGLKTAGGVIDSGYRGEYTIIVHNLSHKDIVIKPGQKIAQVLIQAVCRPEIELVEELSETARQANGFGSTGI